jgi:aldose 1-epimerase
MVIQNKYVRFKKIKLIEVTNALGLKVVFCSFGAAIKGIYLDNELLTDQENELSKFMFSSSYNGKTVGRTCGRIKDGIFKIGQDVYQVRKKDKNSLHGGIKSFSYRNFKTYVEENDSFYQINFSRISKDKEEGYPGNLSLNVKYTVYKNQNKIEVEFKAISDKDTICNLTNHNYWRLGEEDVSQIKLTIDASKYVEVDKDLLFVKEDKVNKIYDFRKGKQIIKDYEEVEKTVVGTYDTDFILDKKKEYDSILEGSKYLLKVKSTYPILHVYSPRPFKGVAIECEGKAYDNESLILEKNKFYKEYISYEIERRK